MGLTSRCTSRCAVAISSSRSLKRAPKRWDQRANHEVSAGFNSFCQLTVYHTLGTMVQGLWMLSEVFFGDDTDFAMLTSSVPTGHSAKGQGRLASMAGLWVVGALA